MSDTLIKVGDVFKVKRTVTRDVYEAFLICSEDRNPLHANDDYARALGYKSKLMHGAILNAFISGLVGTGLPSNDTMCLSQMVNFKKPFFCEDEILIDATVSDVQPSPHAGLLVALKLRFSVADNVVATGQVQLLMDGFQSKMK